MNCNRGTTPEDCLSNDARWLRDLAERLIGDATLADDACQEAWLAAGRQGIASQDQRRPLLFRVMRRFAWRWRRAEARRSAREAQCAKPEALPSTEELLLRGEQRRTLWRRLAELDEPYRTVLLLRYQEGLDTRAIAQRSRSPEDTVRRRIRRGLQLLRDRYQYDRDGRGGLASLVAAALPLGSSSTSAAASVAAIAAPSVAAFVGAWMMKKSLAVAGLLLVAALASAVAWSMRETPSPQAPSADQTQIAIAPSSHAAGEAAADPVAVERSDAPAPASPIAAATPPEACRVVGIIADEAGQPLTGATVQLLYGSSHYAAVPDWQREVHSDFDGRFELYSNGMQTAEQIRLVVDMSPLYQRVERTFGGGPQHDFGPLQIAQVDVGTITVAAASAVAGRLLDERGAPIAQAWIDNAHGAQFTRSDRDGRFLLPHLKPGRNQLRFASAGYLEHEEPYTLPTSEVHDLGDIVLRSAPYVKGVVTDLEGNALLDATVSTRGFTRGWVFETDGGRFDVPLPSADAGRIIARANGYEQSEGTRVAPGQQDVVIQLLPTVPRGVFAIVDGNSGTAVTRFGLRIREGAGSKAGATKPKPVYGPPQTRTFGNGRAAAASRAGIDQVEVVAPGYRPVVVDVTELAFTKVGQRIELQPIPGLRGRIVDQQGVGVASRQVVLVFGKQSRVSDADTDKPVPYDKDSDLARAFNKQGSFSMYSFVALHQPLPPFVLSKSTDASEHKAFTDEQGCFHFAVANGAGRLLASDANGHVLASERFFCGADGRDLGDLPLVAPARLRARLVPSIAVNMSGSIVTLGSDPDHTSPVAADGTFEFAGLPPGEHWFSIKVGEHVSAPKLWMRSWFVRLQAGKDHAVEVPIAVQAACRLQASLRVNGSAATGGSIDFSIDGSNDQVGDIAIGSEGHGVGTVPAGVALRARCEVDGVVLTMADSFVLPAGTFARTFELQTAALEVWLPKTLELPADGTLRLQWRLPNGNPGQPLRLWVRDRERILGTTATGDLRLLFPHVPVGATSCFLELRSGQPYSQEPWIRVGTFDQVTKPGGSHRVVLQ